MFVFVPKKLCKILTMPLRLKLNLFFLFSLTSFNSYSNICLNPDIVDVPGATKALFSTDEAGTVEHESVRGDGILLHVLRRHRMLL